jgi:hypothetical protein
MVGIRPSVCLLVNAGKSESETAALFLLPIFFCIGRKNCDILRHVQAPRWQDDFSMKTVQMA